MAVAPDEWISLFVEERGSLPEKVENLDAFIRNRGGKVKYAEVRQAFRERAAAGAPAASPACKPVQAQAHGSATAAEAAASVPPVAVAAALAAVATLQASPMPKPASSHRPTRGSVVADATVVAAARKVVTEAAPAPGKDADADAWEVARKTWANVIQEAPLNDIPGAFARLPEAARADGEFMLGMVRQHSLHLRYASRELADDAALVMVAVKRHGPALQYASERLRADGAVIRAAVQWHSDKDYDLNPLKYVSMAAVKDVELMTSLVALQPSVIRARWFFPSLLDDRKFMLSAIANSSSALQHAADALKADGDLVLFAVSRDPFTLRFAAESVRSDWGVVLAAMKVNKDVFRYAAPELRACREEFEQMLLARAILTVHLVESEEGKEVELKVRAMRLSGAVAAEVSLLKTQTLRELRDALSEELQQPVYKFELITVSGETLPEGRNCESLAEVLQR